MDRLMEEPNNVVAAMAPSLFTDDLVAEALKHINFLQGLHAMSVTLTKPSHKSLDRYLNQWLPLVAAHMPSDVKSNQVCTPNFIPPPDIAWLWHCHRLAPARYARHVQHRFQRLVEAPQNAFDFQAKGDDRLQAQETRLLWNKRFPNESFFVEEEEEKKESMDAQKNDGMIKYGAGTVCIDAFLNEFGMIGSTAHQATFLWQVSGVRYGELEFLQQGVKNYTKFLQLFRLGHGTKPTPLVPTNHLDLIWHTHILKSLELYNRECIQIAGMRIDHDDSLNDRTEGGLLDLSFQATSLVWKETYDEDYVVCGGMYRGEPPAEYWDPTWDPRQDQEQLKRMLLNAGAFSMGKPPEPNVPPTWLKAGLNVYWEGRPTFIPANAKSRERGVNNNEKIMYYVFGVPQGGFGITHIGAGYYHMYTREGWSILIRRLQSQARKGQADADCLLCCMCSCGKADLRPRQLARFEPLEEKARNLDNMVAYAQAQLESSGPAAELSPAIVAKYRLGERTPPGHSDKRADRDTGSDGGAMLVMYGAAACGGGGIGGGGAACGGAACGGGGCGGGGGGGCGGGGCGGGCGG